MFLVLIIEKELNIFNNMLFIIMIIILKMQLSFLKLLIDLLMMKNFNS